MKQIALAMHNYNDVHKRLPEYVIAAGTATEVFNWAWGATILPFVEQQAVHDKLGITQVLRIPRLNAAATPADIKLLLQSTFPVYRCPSDTGTPTNPNFKAPTEAYGTCNYAMSLGVGRVSPENCNGRLQEITDGLSNTMLVTEKALNETSRRKRSVGGVWVTMPTTAGSVSVTARWPPNTPYEGAWPCCGSDPDAKRANAISMHPGGLNVGLCDGSVVFVSETIEASPVVDAANWATRDTLSNNFVWRKLYWANDGYALGSF